MRVCEWVQYVVNSHFGMVFDDEYSHVGLYVLLAVRGSMGLSQSGECLHSVGTLSFTLALIFRPYLSAQGKVQLLCKQP